MGNNFPSLAAIKSAAHDSATKYGLDPAVFLGLIQQESNFDVTASPGTTSAYGLTQLVKGTAKQMGVTDRGDYLQQLDGGAKYLSQQVKKFGSVEKGLAAYYQGPGSVARGGVSSAGAKYSQEVIAKSRAYASTNLSNVAGRTVGAIGEALGAAGSAVMLGGKVVGDAVDKVTGWEGQMKRLALAVVALLMIAAALFLFGKGGAQSFAKSTIKSAIS